MQHSKSTMKQIEPSYRGSRWSQWSLHDSGLYYYRARYISLEDISSIRPTGRDWFVPNVRGGYIHYESRAVSEAAIQSPSIQTPEFSTCSITTTTTATNDSPAASSQTTDEIVAEASSRDSMLMSGALQTEADVTEAVIIMSRPAQLKRTSTTPKKQKDKKHGKKVDVDKRKSKQVSNKVKVNKWLDAL